MILMIYRTYESGQPEIVSLNRNFTDEEFAQFVGKVAQTVSTLGKSGYEPASLTFQPFSVEGGHVTSLGEFHT